MNNYKKPNRAQWVGRTSNEQLYFHEKVKCVDIENEELPSTIDKSFAILGYACDEGVQRNNGRVGAAEGPKAIRKILGSLSNHLKNEITIVDTGDIICNKKNLDYTQSFTSDKLLQLIKNKYFTILLGGGHDLAYAHYNGLKKNTPNSSIGIINLDAHFDLREVKSKGNSGTPFYQIANQNDRFKYLCLGIQKESNNRKLFETAHTLEVQYIENINFNIQNKDNIVTIIHQFITSVDFVYLTIDMDGFSSSYAPGVSAPSPLGFSPDIALFVIEKICNSGKLISADIVELNPRYDIDECTARLAARLVYKIISEMTNL